MLILTRKAGEGIYQSNGVKITVVEIKGRQVRLGIEGPKTILFHRDELHASRAGLIEQPDGVGNVVAPKQFRQIKELYNLLVVLEGELNTLPSWRDAGHLRADLEQYMRHRKHTTAIKGGK